MFPTRTTLCLGLTVLFSFALAASSAIADDGQPVAIRHWEGGGFTIETMWGFHIGLGVDEKHQSVPPRKPDIDLSVVLAGKTSTMQRLPNQAKITISTKLESSDDGNAVVLSRANGEVASTVTVDGLTIVYLNDKVATDVSQQLSADNKSPLGLPVDASGESLVVIATGDQYDEETCAAIVASLKPRLMLVNANLKKVGGSTVKTVPHNTVAVSNSKRPKQNTQFVSLATQPYQLSPELKELFAKKEAACKKSRAVFAALSVAQLNFRPDNGTHTPRWNTEHMMGRELHFFSQIYHAVAPEVPVINLNPAQMPKSYKFAHPDWTGKEEALQTRRVEAFTRRFAYLLDGMDLNKRAKGSRFWTPRKLLAQMERHYKEHTDNVGDKMKLEGWPAE
jgi:hypothetical protein